MHVTFLEPSFPRLSLLFWVNKESLANLTSTYVDAIFGPVTWHDQRRPLCPRHDLQNKKGSLGVGRWGLLRRSSPSNVYIEKRERESDRRSSPNDFLYSLFILTHVICLFCHCQARSFMWTPDFFSDLI